MNYTVLWQPAAEEQLAALWTSAEDRNDVAAAADAIDARLRRNPLAEGESRGGVRRILFIPPLVALFVVDEPNRTVYVRAVGLARRPC